MVTFQDTARRALAISAMAIGGLALALLAAMAFVPMLVSKSDLRRLSTDAIMQATGQMASLDGEAEFKLFPLPQVHLTRVVFPLPGGGTLDAEGAVANLKLMPLLVGRIEVADVALERPTLIVTSTASAPPVAVAALVVSRDAPELRLVKGTVVLRARDGLTRELINGIDARLVRTSGGAGASLSAVFTWRDVECEARISIANVLDFLTGKTTETRVELATGGSWMRFRGTASGGRKPGANGDVSGETPSLRGLLTWIGLDPPTAGGLKQFAFSGKVQASEDAAAFTALTLKLDGNQSEGALSAKLDAGRPMIQGTFASDRLDVTPYGRMMLSDAATNVWDRTPLDLKRLSRLDLDLRFSAASVTADESTFERVATSAMVRSGRLTVAVGTAHAWGGDVRASLSVGPAPDGQGATVRVEAEGNKVALLPALDDLMGVRRLDGTGDLEVQLEGSGSSILDIAQSLTGHIELTGTDGAVLGIDVAQVLNRIERRPLSGGGDLRGGKTAYDTLAAKVQLDRGTATIEEASVRGKQVSLSLSGNVSVARREIDLKGEAILLSPPPAAGTDRPKPDFDLPFMVQGPWSGAFVVLDPQILIRRSGAAQPLLEAVRNRSNGEAAVRSVIEQLAKPSALPPVPAKAAGN
ncbi:AsmA family protein [Aquabacter sp. L1I39]|uniref:AsmA family protein n=1 Tax=Aquabacter sp. L1I39 TaxID=2820278 RepID=UPI001ADCA979|nr:AsmA family protein [Aquabacter sp. L1I39]QTL02601.1 AsmA family protein [Aquabacter sp. L1I39]